MGKSQKPLTILVMDEALYQNPAIQALQKKGHTVLEATGTLASELDVIIGPRCWRVDPQLGNLDAILEMVLKGVRGVKYASTKAKS